MTDSFKMPEFLQKGDTIGIIAPARKISVQEIQAAISIFNNWGLNVKLGTYLFGAENQFSGKVHERLSDFQDMLNDNEVKAIFAARGGYGSVHLIDKIDFTPFIAKPKWLVGFSDFTVLHTHVNIFNIASLHAPMAINFHNKDISAESISMLKDVLFGELKSISFKPYFLNRTGMCEAPVVGGNLSVIYSLMGSPSEIQTKNKILFLEDLDEYLYHIDRMMMCLKRAGKFDGIKGLIIGGMSDMNDNTIPFGKNALEIIAEVIGAFNFPVCFNFPSGHIKDNFPLILGKKISLHVNTESVEINYKD